MGLLDYYRQFDDIGESEVNRELRERRAREKALALERVPVLDLSGTEWPESAARRGRRRLRLPGARAAERLPGH